MIDTKYYFFLSTLLKEVQSIGEMVNAFIAGGAIRDELLDKPVSDIDVFIPISPFLEGDFKEIVKKCVSDYKEQYDLVFVNDTKEKIDMLSEYTASYSVHTYITTYEDQKVKVQLIFELTYNSAKNIVDDFPCSLSSVYFDGSSLYLSKQFLRDSANKTITFSNNISTKYEKKMTEKYSDYKVKYETVETLPF